MTTLKRGGGPPHTPEDPQRTIGVSDNEPRLRDTTTTTGVTTTTTTTGVLDNESQLSQALSLLEDYEVEQLVGATLDELTVQVAMDSGSCANVIHPDDLPETCIVTPKEPNEKDFHGAGGDPIKKHGRVKTMMRGARGAFTTDWQSAEVTRALHSVSTVCGPEDHDTGLQDVLFNNKHCFVVPPGIVAAIMRKVKAVAEYKRTGGLYLADFKVSSFARQGQGA